MKILDLFFWPPMALARWVNDGPDRTAMDRAFYEMLYCSGWALIWAILLLFTAISLI